MLSLSLAEYLQAAASALAAGRIIQLRLVSRQPALLAFLLCTSLDLLLLATLNPASATYAWVYLLGDALNWIVGLLVVRETFTLAFTRYRGIRTVGRWALYTAIVLSVITSALVTFVFRHESSHGKNSLYHLQIVNRCVEFTLAAIIIGLLIVLVRYRDPLHLNRNAYVSNGFFSAVFLSEAITMLIDSSSTFLYSGVTDAFR